MYFPIVLTQIGNVEIWVQAQTGVAGDAVQQNLKVEPEGYRVNRNVPLVVDLSSSSSSGRAPTANSIIASGEPTNQATASAAAAVAIAATSATSDLGLVSGNSLWKKTIEMHFPEDFVEGSRRAKIDIIGNK